MPGTLSPNESKCIGRRAKIDKRGRKNGSEKELKNPEVKDYVEEFYSFGSDEPTGNIMKVHKLLQHWTAGQHGVATWHGAGPVMAQKIMLQRVIDYEHEKNIVKMILDLKEK